MNSNPNPQEDKSNKQPEPLYELIHSMTANEKRYFNVQVNKQKASDDEVIEYFVLFKILNKMKTYDEKKAKTQLLKTIGKEKYSNFAVKKNELYDVLMRQLKNYAYIKMKESADYIKVLIYDANFLFKRGLFKQAKKHLKEARKMAEECGDTLSLLEINRVEREYYRTNRVLKMEELMRELHKEEEKLMKDLKVESELIRDYDLLISKRLQQSKLIDKKSIQKLKDEFGHLEEMEGNEELPINAKRFLLIGRADFLHMVGDYYKLLEIRKKHLDWWKENEWWKRQMPYNYINALSNLLGVYHELKDYRKFPELLEKLEKTSTGNLYDEEKRFHRLMMYRLIYFLNVGLLDEACNLSSIVLKGLKKYKLNQGVKMVLIFNVLIAFFLNQKYKDFLEWIKFLRPFQRLEIRKLLIQFSQLLRVIAYYELEDIDNMDNAYRSAKRYYVDVLKMSPNEFELVLLELLKKLSEVIPRRQKEVKLEIKGFLQLTYDSQETKGQVGLEELLIWINSSLTNFTMKDILREKNKKRSS